MADELETEVTTEEVVKEELDLDALDADINQTNKIQDRIKNLSSKVKMTSEERDEFQKLNTELTDSNDTLTKERDFFKGFSTLSPEKYPNVAEHQDAIRDKVLAGYSMEDAALTVLAKEGKLPQVEVAPEVKEDVAGGSAPNAITSDGEKTLAEMTMEDKRAKLVELETKGEIGLS